MISRPDRVQVVLHRVDRPSLPPGLRGLLREPLLQPIDVQPLAEEEEAPRHLEHRATRGARATEMMSGPCTSSSWNACRRASSSGTPSAMRRAASRSRCSRHASGPICSITDDSSRNVGPRLLDRLAEPQAGRADEVPARGRLDEPVDAVISSFWISGSILPSRDSIVVPSRHRADDVARDPERSHDLRRGRPRLRDEPRHERDSLGVDDVVRHDRRDQLAPQRMLAQHRPEPVDDLSPGSTAPGPARGTRESGRSASSRSRLIERFEYATRSASSGRVSPSPRPRRSAISSDVGRNSTSTIQLAFRLELKHQVLACLVPLGRDRRPLATGSAPGGSCRRAHDGRRRPWTPPAGRCVHPSSAHRARSRARGGS